jgi:hypothetical protein
MLQALNVLSSVLGSCLRGALQDRKVFHRMLSTTIWRSYSWGGRNSEGTVLKTCAISTTQATSPALNKNDLVGKILVTQNWTTTTSKE